MAGDPTGLARLGAGRLHTAAEVSGQDLPRHVAADLAVQSFRRSVAP